MPYRQPVIGVVLYRTCALLLLVSLLAASWTERMKHAYINTSSACGGRILPAVLRSHVCMHEGYLHRCVPCTCACDYMSARMLAFSRQPARFPLRHLDLAQLHNAGGLGGQGASRWRDASNVFKGVDAFRAAALAAGNGSGGSVAGGSGGGGFTGRRSAGRS